MKRYYFLLAGLILSFILWSCQQDGVLSSSKQESSVTVTINGLNDQADTTWYEAWLLPKDGSSVDSVLSLGILEKQDNGSFSVKADVNSGFLQTAENVIITMELDSEKGYQVKNDSTKEAGPSAYIILAGELLANEGTVGIGHAKLIDFDLTSAVANYIIDTPTDPQNRVNKAGIWFLNIDTTRVLDSLGNVVSIDTTFSAGINLPAAPDGWSYGARISDGTQTVSLGAFTDPAKADNAAKYNGTNGTAYAFPGEDFIQSAPAGLTFPMNVTGKELTVTITPRYPKKSVPFVVEAFKGTIPTDSAVKTKLELPLMLENFPGGELKIELNIY
ncbi:MAG: hypothetical protein H6627_03590 [Calditrichae bacterium]|nr:hypothetical protein [Calditrichota bacterium]MCB9057622.1 hypothetical protein [Calditrichia bacterium]